MSSFSSFFSDVGKKISKQWERLVALFASDSAPSTPAPPVVVTPDVPPVVDPVVTPPPAQGVAVDELDASLPQYLHQNVAAWPITSVLGPIRISGNTLYLEHTKAKVWPQHSTEDLAANPWVVAQRDGRWYAATFEWLRSGGTTRGTKAVAGDYIKKFNVFPKEWRPKSGETLYFMVSTLCRDKRRTLNERTQLVKFIWP